MNLKIMQYLWKYSLPSLGVLFFVLSCAPTTPTRKPDIKKTCAQCHPEIVATYENGFVHQPVKEKNCEACHLNHGLVPMVVMRQPVPTVCLPCHPALNKTGSKKSAHKPVSNGKCKACHEPHNSEHPNLLNTAAEKICYNCHKPEPFTRETVHEPVKDGCSTCHLAHMSDYSGLLKKTSNELCSSCHEFGSSEFIAAHQGYPVITRCINCHAQHSSSDPGLLREVIHPPVRDGDCNDCHLIEGSSIKVQSFDEGLCLTCHEDIPGAAQHEPVKEGDCQSCHDVHASEFDGMLADKPTKLCLDCHDQGEKTTGVQSVHEPAGKGKCQACHKGHAAPNRALLKNDSPALCFSCHDRKVYADTLQPHAPAKEGLCLDCHSSHKSNLDKLLTKRESNLCFSCHQNTHAEIGLFSQHKPFTTGQCTSCHAPHGGNKSGLLKIVTDNGELCLTCHEKLIDKKEMKNMHSPFAEGECLVCHGTHATNQANLIKDEPGQVCFTCHSDIESEVDRYKVQHDPVAKKQCVVCHSGHGSPHPGYQTKGQPALCLGCHGEIAKFWRDGSLHPPAAEDCTTCHNAHGSDNAALTLVASSGQLCAECHDMDNSSFIDSHQGIWPRSGSCVSCHDPHGGPKENLLYPINHDPFSPDDCSECHETKQKLPTAAICFSCHERDSFQKRVKHEPAVNEDCLTCHNPHVARFSGLLMEQVQDVCFSCHSELADEQQQGMVHKPFKQGECLSCHKPHASDQAGLLIERPSDICFNCHTDLPRKFKNTHSPYAKGKCATCHKPHQSPYANLLIKKPYSLCLGCHPLGSLRQKHRNYPAELGNCGSCHNPHGSDRPALIRNILHEPYADGCQDCHAGKGVPVLIDTCLECHSEISDQMASSHNHLIRYKDNGCMACHTPHAGEDNRLLKEKKELHICGKCHEATFKRHDTAEFKHSMTDACNNCHAPHGSNHPAMAKAPINSVCGECHEQHSSFTHPIGENILDPRTGQMMTCTSCHASKGTNYDYHTRFNRKKALCLQCHAAY